MLFKRITALLVLCLSLISVSTTLSVPKHYIRKSPSLISKITDLGLCATIATSTGVGIHKIVEFALTNKPHERFEHYRNAIISCSLAAIAATILYCKNQWQVQKFIEVENEQNR